MIARSTFLTMCRVTAVFVFLIFAVSQSMTLLANNGEGYRGVRPWWQKALGGLVAIPVVGGWLAFEAMTKDSAFRVREDRIEHSAWKRPLYFRDIDTVVFEEPKGAGDVAGVVALKLSDGATQHLPYSLTGQDPEVFVADLRARIAKLRAVTPRPAGI